MKHMPLLFIFSCFILAVGCQESTKKSTTNNSNNYNCYYNPSAPGCIGSTVGGTIGGSTGTSGGSTGGSIGGTTGNPNPFPSHNSVYAEKNWMAKYPYPGTEAQEAEISSCSTPYTPSGISYTPYETRKGTITLGGKNSYDPASSLFTSRTSQLLRTVDGAREFFWADSTLKIRFKANLQPDSRNSTDICAGRVPNQSTIKGYTRMMFDLELIGRKADNQIGTETIGTYTVDILKCTPAIDLSYFATKYPNGIYFRVSNVYGNQEWSPTAYFKGYDWYGNPIYDQSESIAWDQWGFYPLDARGKGNKYYSGNGWKRIRDADCWSLDIEVAADGTKTFN